jgi:hypothetical protein
MLTRHHCLSKHLLSVFIHRSITHCTHSHFCYLPPHAPRAAPDGRLTRPTRSSSMKQRSINSFFGGKAKTDANDDAKDTSKQQSDAKASAASKARKLEPMPNPKAKDEVPHEALLLGYSNGSACYALLTFLTCCTGCGTARCAARAQIETSEEGSRRGGTRATGENMCSNISHTV